MTLDPIKIVSIADPAIDVAAMGGTLRPYIAKRDFAALRFVEGARPTVYHVGWIDAMAFRSYICATPDDPSVSEFGGTSFERAWRAFECGVVRIECADGSVLEPAREEPLANGQIRKRWTPEQMESIAVSDVEDVGTVAYVRSRVGKARQATYPLLPGSQSAWMTRTPCSPPAAPVEAPTGPG
jgi:hypothetical protein